MKTTLRKITAIISSAAVLISLAGFSGIGSVSADAAESDPVSRTIGDVDGNGSVDSSDALLVMRYSVGLADLTEVQQTLADVNGDGICDSMDALLILQNALGMIEMSSSGTTAAMHTYAAPEEGSIELEYARKVVELCNKERTSRGIAPLVIDSDLMAAAACRSDELDEEFDHMRPNGSKWSTVLREYDVHYLVAGENIAGGIKTPEDVVEGWMNSESHRKNILCEDYTSIGVSYRFIEDSRYGWYWDQVFIGTSENFENETNAKEMLLGQINEERARQGLKELKVDSTLANIAEIRANEVAATQNFDGVRPDGTSWKTILGEYSVEYTTIKQEICAGQQTSGEVYMYYTRDGKIPSFLNPEKDYAKIGIGHAYVENDKYSHYWIIFLSD